MPFRDSRIPPPGSVSQVERMFRMNWIGHVTRSPSGVPLLRPDFVAKQGRKVRLIDVRDESELTGMLGYIHGSDWVPAKETMSVFDRVHRDDAIVFVSAGEERSGAAALALEKKGLRFVACMMGGIVAWRDDGYTTTRDPQIVARRGIVRAIDDVVDETPNEVTPDEIERHVGDPLSVRWIKLPALLVRGLVSCVDGRDDSGVIGAAGGDAGELLVGLRALENLTRHTLSDANVETLLARRNDVFGRFYMHTDVESASSAVAPSTDPYHWRRVWDAPPPDLRDELLARALEPAHIGCGHLRLQLTDAQAYGTREGLVRCVLSAFHRTRWQGHPDMEYVPLAGGHTERAVVNVRIAGPLLPFSRIPLVSPAVGDAQVFVHHPRITSYLRKQLAAFLALQHDIVGPDLDAESLHEEMVRVGAVQLNQTLLALAKGLPIYDVTFHGETRVEVKQGGVVGG